VLRGQGTTGSGRCEVAPCVAACFACASIGEMRSIAMHPRLTMSEARKPTQGGLDYLPEHMPRHEVPGKRKPAVPSCSRFAVL
jgi:hypothetical protein